MKIYNTYFQHYEFNVELYVHINIYHHSIDYYTLSSQVNLIREGANFNSQFSSNDKRKFDFLALSCKRSKCFQRYHNKDNMA